MRQRKDWRNEMEFNHTHVLSTIESTLKSFMQQVEGLPPMDWALYDSDKTLIVMVDMINGFAKFGPLSSPYVDAMIPQMGRFLDEAIHRDIPIISYRDAHPEQTAEFKFFPPHCLEGSEESALVSELERPELMDIKKNSTNGFLAKNPLTMVSNPSAITSVIVIGCVTDICIRDFASSMNKYFQEINQNADVIVIENLVDTFDIEGSHDRQSEHLLALYQMSQAGIKLFRYND